MVVRWRSERGGRGEEEEQQHGSSSRSGLLMVKRDRQAVDSHRPLARPGRSRSDSEDLVSSSRVGLASVQ